MRTFCFYMDDSGSRYPDKHNDGGAATKWDAFVLGGVLIDEARKDDVKNMLADFRARWPQINGREFRSRDIRCKTERFRWLATEAAEKQRDFFSDLDRLMAELPVHALACVVDRPGYNFRYQDAYAGKPWMLCRTAFVIAVERAVKVCRHFDARLRVIVEESNPVEDKLLSSYYEELRSDGHPFNAERAAIYSPVRADEFAKTLLEFSVKKKANPYLQIADLVVWPLRVSGYDKLHAAYLKLKNSGKLVESMAGPDVGLLGTKYSCFERPETQRPVMNGSRAAVELPGDDLMGYARKRFWALCRRLSRFESRLPDER